MVNIMFLIFHIPHNCGIVSRQFRTLSKMLPEIDDFVTPVKIGDDLPKKLRRALVRTTYATHITTNFPDLHWRVSES